MNLYKKKPFQRHSESFLVGYWGKKGRESQPDRQAGLPYNKIPTPVCRRGRASIPKSTSKPRNDGFFQDLRKKYLKPFGQLNQ